ncbi:HNH endonuclease signature motif containing protein [Bremerella cremea]|uniref:HNH endonuclease signature motif containing protein n=1 Tax=Pirellulaceae TaxID=2691357 RepID=UPI000DF42D04|nr:HNH endonuclease [Bremerella cremea]
MVPNRYEQSQQRKEDRAFYSSARWQRCRKRYIQQQPLCECGCGEMATEVHHKIDRKERPDLAFDFDNLEAMTKPCHSRITRERQLEKKSSKKEEDGNV